MKYNGTYFRGITWFVVLFLVLLLNSCIKGIKSSELRFLKNNNNSITLDSSDFSTLKLLDDSLTGKEIFLTGELHGVGVNSELNIRFLKYFKNKADIQYYLAEMPYSESIYINEYLKTGNQQILDKQFGFSEGTYSWTIEEYNLWKEIYQFNQSLPKEKRIRIVGADIEHNLKRPLQYLYSCISKTNIPEIKKDIVSQLKNLAENKDNKFTENDVKDYASKLKNDIEINKNLYKESLGEDFFDFTMICDNIIKSFEVYSYIQNNDAEGFNRIRDKLMYENFIRIYSYLPKGKYYGQMGLNHVYQKKQINVQWFASLLNNESSPIKDKLLSIVYLYKDSYRMKNINYENASLTSYVDPSKTLENFIESDLTLFKLNGDNSPFNKSLMWFIGGDDVGPRPNEGVTTDYFQYVVFIKNAKPTTPFNKK